MGKQHKLSHDYLRLASKPVIQSFDSIIIYLRTLTEDLNKYFNEIASVTNRQTVKYFSQNGALTAAEVPDGQMAIWKDADATSTNPTHYLVYNDAGTIITFASEEVVP